MSKHVKALREVPHDWSCDVHEEPSVCDCGLAAAAAHLERTEKRLAIAEKALMGHPSPAAHEDALAKMKAVK